MSRLQKILLGIASLLVVLCLGVLVFILVKFYYVSAGPSGVESTTNVVTTTHSEPMVESVIIPSIDDIRQFAAQQNIPIDEVELTNMTAAERYLEYGLLLEQQPEAGGYQLGYIILTYNTAYTKSGVEQKLRAAGYTIYDPFMETSNQMMELGAISKPLHQNEVMIKGIGNIIEYEYAECRDQFDAFVAAQKFQPYGETSDQFIVPHGTTLETVVDLMSSETYPCMVAQQWTVTQINNQTVIGADAAGLGLAELSLQDNDEAVINDTLVALSDEPLFQSCEATYATQPNGLIWCTFGDETEAVITDLLKAHNVTQSKFFIWNFTGVLTPYHEEKTHGEKLKQWDEINNYEVNAYLSLDSAELSL